MPKAAKELAKLEKLGFGGMPVCMAKTQYSFSDDPKKLGAPRGFRITVRDVKVSAGAGFVVALTGNIMTMPGLGESRLPPSRSTWTRPARSRGCFKENPLRQLCARCSGARALATVVACSKQWWVTVP